MIRYFSPGRVAVGLTVANLVLMGLVVIFYDPFMGLVLPLWWPFSAPYWIVAALAAGFAIRALTRRRWRGAVVAGLLFAMTLVPSAGLWLECSLGNCI